ncbi:hypothetical protein ACGIF2_14630 [Cellulomonas sp. P22]|uniref:hypothetical protein n=1 Tax=Cellulomonas sp. P22 TaxID=3373189 RepID=UPI0037ACD90A
MEQTPGEPHEDPSDVDAADYDTDADPDNLNPRSGANAAGDPTDDPDADTDADPHNLNPRHDRGSQQH